VIGKVVPRRGGGVIGLLAYLYRDGEAGEKNLCSAHVNPRMIASWDGNSAALEPPICGAGRRDYARLAELLEAPVRAAGMPDTAKPVYHLVLATAKEQASGRLVDPYLSDDQWRDIAQEFMHRLGLAPRGDPDGVRWVAIRHADDHVHVVATLARLDGKRASTHGDYRRSRQACTYIEAKYGLVATSPAAGTAVSHPSQAETHKTRAVAQHDATRPSAARVRREPARIVLRRRVRTAAAGARNLEEFFARLRADRVLVRPRCSERNPGQVTGYAVALHGDTDRGGQPIFFGGGKLAPDLTLPKLQRRWDLATTGTGGASRASGVAANAPASEEPASTSPASGRNTLDNRERARIWEEVIGAAARATRQVTAAAFTDPAAAGDAAWAAADFLIAAARVVEGRRRGPLTAAAEEYDRAAREMFGRIPQPRHAGHEMRRASRQLLTARAFTSRDTRRLFELLARMVAFTEAVARLRETQGRTAQAAAARRAAEQLEQCHLVYSVRGASGVAASAPRRRSAVNTSASAAART
jgi:hypothetical protein